MAAGLRYALKRFTQPVFFQGSLRKTGYFEGWYFKHVSQDRRSVFALIPGISLSPSGSKSFVQVIDGTTGATHWHAFPLSAFSFSRKKFEIRVADNTFSLDGIDALLRNDEGDFQAHLRYDGVTPLPFFMGSPGIMGPYTYAPFMECYHGIGSLDHEIVGYVRTGGTEYSFSGGRGYIEKDWGRSFPRAWIWSQSNNFSAPGTCFLFSLARIPWMGRTFVGFFSLLLEGGRIHRLATYTGAIVTDARLHGRQMTTEIRSPRLSLSLRVERTREGVLLAPVQGAMDRRIGESIDARVHVRLAGPRGTVLFEGTGEAAGLEAVGDMRLLGVEEAAGSGRSTG
jgi:tocopherol cyclase